MAVGIVQRGPDLLGDGSRHRPARWSYRRFTPTTQRHAVYVLHGNGRGCRRRCRCRRRRRCCDGAAGRHARRPRQIGRADRGWPRSDDRPFSTQPDGYCPDRKQDRSYKMRSAPMCRAASKGPISLRFCSMLDVVKDPQFQWFTIWDKRDSLRCTQGRLRGTIDVIDVFGSTRCRFAAVARTERPRAVHFSSCAGLRRRLLRMATCERPHVRSAGSDVTSRPARPCKLIIAAVGQWSKLDRMMHTSLAHEAMSADRYP